MMNTDIQDTIDSLDDLLDEERAALLAGNLDVMARLMKRKESLTDVLNNLEKPDFDLLSDLNAKVVRNQALLNSALEGIKSVADRLTVMRQIKNSLDTYDAQGKRKKIDMPLRGAVEKRA